MGLLILDSAALGLVELGGGHEVLHDGGVAGEFVGGWGAGGGGFGDDGFEDGVLFVWGGDVC